MKPSQEQIDVALVMAAQCDFFAITNDINSPSHFCEIDTDVEQLDLTDEQQAELKEVLYRMLTVIRKIK